MLHPFVIVGQGHRISAILGFMFRRCCECVKRACVQHGLSRHSRIAFSAQSEYKSIGEEENFTRIYFSDLQWLVLGISVRLYKAEFGFGTTEVRLELHKYRVDCRLFAICIFISFWVSHTFTSRTYIIFTSWYLKIFNCWSKCTRVEGFYFLFAWSLSVMQHKHWIKQA